MTHLSSLGFPINRHSKIMNNLKDCHNYFLYMSEIRETIPYEIDGLVYRVNDFSKYEVNSIDIRAASSSIYSKMMEKLVNF